MSHHPWLSPQLMATGVQAVAISHLVWLLELGPEPYAVNARRVQVTDVH